MNTRALPVPVSCFEETNASQSTLMTAIHEHEELISINVPSELYGMDTVVGFTLGATQAGGSTISYVNACAKVADPVGPETCTSTTPDACGGVTAETVVSFVTVNDTAAAPPNRTLVTESKFVPLMVTAVPPLTSPRVGLILVRDGAAAGGVGVATGAAWVTRTEADEPEKPVAAEITIVPSRATVVGLTLKATEAVPLPRVTSSIHDAAVATHGHVLVTSSVALPPFAGNVAGRAAALIEHGAAVGVGGGTSGVPWRIATA